MSEEIIEQKRNHLISLRKESDEGGGVERNEKHVVIKWDF